MCKQLSKRKSEKITQQFSINYNNCFCFISILLYCSFSIVLEIRKLFSSCKASFETFIKKILYLNFIGSCRNLYMRRRISNKGGTTQELSSNEDLGNVDNCRSSEKSKRAIFEQCGKHRCSNRYANSTKQFPATI